MDFFYFAGRGYIVFKYIGVIFNFLSWNYFVEMNAIFLLVVIGYAKQLNR